MPTPVKYPQLQDVSWVKEQLVTQKKSMQTLAEEVGCPASCIRWVVQRKMGAEDRALISYERKPHENKRKVK